MAVPSGTSTSGWGEGLPQVLKGKLVEISGTLYINMNTFKNKTKLALLIYTKFTETYLFWYKLFTCPLSLCSSSSHLLFLFARRMSLFFYMSSIHMIRLCKGSVSCTVFVSYRYSIKRIGTFVKSTALIRRKISPSIK